MAQDLEQDSNFVWFANGRGEKLHGQFYPCATNPNECAILVHGLMSNKDVNILTAIGRAISESVTCFAFDFPGQGKSEGEFEYGASSEIVIPSHHFVAAILRNGLNSLQVDINTKSMIYSMRFKCFNLSVD